MKAATILCFAATALAGAIEARNGHCGGDNCARQVTGTRDGLTPIESRKADCTSFMRSTVLPDAVTTTVTVTLDPSQTAPKLRRDATTVATATASVVPAYASGCKAASAYSSACACWGITAQLATGPTPTKTATVTVTGDFCEDL
ncbi:hypothetical protein DCS_08201 [Drechmeria coniospora]|uniref:Uncharacterized protein n=1 Tax=Drechmeria coniospora TaxID=98403 RepID=A0A151GGP1_DRECN|nr:hypothetical protein DCS_08201 [Drechmeria coniospora]KYK56232.1 hypothetical protein DCS_08201 [Drechmeria coniospora]